MILIKGQCLRFFLWVYLKNILFVPNSASPLFYLSFIKFIFYLHLIQRILLFDTLPLKQLHKQE